MTTFAPFPEFPDLSEADGVHPSHPHANALTLELVSKYKVTLQPAFIMKKYAKNSW